MKWALLILSMSGQPATLGSVQNFVSAEECAGAKLDVLKQFDADMKKRLRLLCVAAPVPR